MRCDHTLQAALVLKPTGLCEQAPTFETGAVDISTDAYPGL